VAVLCWQCVLLGKVESERAHSCFLGNQADHILARVWPVKCLVNLPLRWLNGGEKRKWNRSRDMGRQQTALESFFMAACGVVGHTGCYLILHFYSSQ